MPARRTSASTGSCRASASSGASFRNAAKTARGAWKIASVRSHHSRSSESRSDVSRGGASTAVRLFDGASI